MKPEDLLEQNGFFDTLEPAISLANAVFVGKKYVVRIAKHEHTDHAREAAIALHALNLGIRTAKPLAWAKQYSIFERLNGSNAAPDSPNAVWLELLLDLKRLHASPFEARKPESMYWDGAVHLLESIFASSLSPAELRVAREMLQPHSATNLVFAHGDAWQSNVITNNNQYVGLIVLGQRGLVAVRTRNCVARGCCANPSPRAVRFEFVATLGATARDSAAGWNEWTRHN